MTNRKEKFSIRKFTQGAFSVLIGASAILNTTPVKAEWQGTSAVVHDYMDSGDAPISYGIATHDLLTRETSSYIGDAQPDGFKGNGSQGPMGYAWSADDYDTNGDESERTFGTVLNVDGTRIYPIQVNVYNDYRSTYLNAWGELDGDGIFTDREMVYDAYRWGNQPINITHIGRNGTSMQHNRGWVGLQFEGQPSAIRIRISHDENSVRTPTGHSSSGEVEDHTLMVGREIAMPMGNHYRTTGFKNQVQTSPTLEWVGYGMFGLQPVNNIMSVKLVHPTTSELLDTITLPEGTYTLINGGRNVQFTPTQDFTGQAQSIAIKMTTNDFVHDLGIEISTSRARNYTTGINDTSVPDNDPQHHKHGSYTPTVVEDNRKFDINYEFTTTSNKPFPQEILNRLSGKNHTQVPNGTTIQRLTDIDTTELVTTDGTWTFDNWNKDSITLNGASENFIGTWTFTEKPVTKYGVKYRFKAENETSYLPGSIIERIPTDNRTFADGESVSPIDTFNGSPYLEPNSVSGIYPEGQYFDFVGWETPTQTVNGQDVEFVGIWRMRPMGYFNVIFNFVNGSRDKYSSLPLPQVVMDLLPPTKTNQPDRSFHTVPRITPRTVEDVENDGIWDFRTWNIRGSGRAIQMKDLEFTGTWYFTPNLHVVTREFIIENAGQPNVPEKPVTMDPLLPPEFEGERGEIDREESTFEDIIVENGKFVFKGWRIKGGDGSFVNELTIGTKDETFEGVWEYRANNYGITYEFTTVEGTTLPLPDAIRFITPSDTQRYTNGNQINPENPVFLEYNDFENDGIWQFVEWDKPNVTINNADEHFIGKWKYTPNTYNVNYTFISDNPAYRLFEGVNNQLPTQENGVTNGTVHNASKSSWQYNSVYDRELDGHWVFVSYIEGDSQTVARGDLTYTGMWSFTQSLHEVEYEFKSSTDKPLPQEILDRIPKDKNRYAKGDKVTAKDFTEKQFTTNEGTWTFKEWDNTEVTVENGNVRFVGTWEFTENTYMITHEFNVEDDYGFELPQEIKDRLNDTNLIDLRNNTSHTPNTSINLENFVDEVNDGTWSFVNWDKPNIIISNENGNFIGTWKFTPNTYKATFEFTTNSGKDLPQTILEKLPTERTELVNTSVIQALPINEIIVDEVNDGVWNFVGWDNDTQTINKDNAHFVGTWNFTANTYEVTHEFIKADTDLDLPNEIIERVLNKNISGIENGTTVYPNNEIILTDFEDTANNGIWRFAGWDKNETIINKANDKFTGKWVFTPKESETQELGSVRVRYENEEGVEILPQVTNRNGVVVNTIHTSGTTVTTTPSNETYDINENLENQIKHGDKDYVFSHVKNNKELIGTIPVGDTTITLVYREMKYTTEEQRGTIEVLFIDELGTEIKNSVLLKDNVLVNTIIRDEQGQITKEELSKETYDVNEVKLDSIDFENYTYTFLEVQQNSLAENGTVPVGYKTIVLVYKVTPKVTETENKGTLTIRYEDENGELLKEEITQDYVVEKITTSQTPQGENVTSEKLVADYDTTELKLDQIQYKHFDYDFVNVKENNEIGQITADESNVVVTYVYKAVPKVSERVEKGSVIVKYETSSGEVLKPSQEIIKEVVTKVYRITETPSGATEELIQTSTETFDISSDRIETIEKDGKTYKLVGKPVEKGEVSSGTTEIVYTYELVETPLIKETSKQEDKPVVKEETKVKENVNTSDTSHPLIYGMSTLFSILGLSTLKRKKRK